MAELVSRLEFAVAPSNLENCKQVQPSSGWKPVVCRLSSGGTSIYTIPTISQSFCLRKKSFWEKRWWKQTLPAPSDWDRMFAFAEAYLPRKQMNYSRITTPQWVEANQRYTKRSARGLDGVDRRDLQWMHPQLMDELVELLNRCEDEASWPQMLRSGSVYPLPKRAEGATVGDYRPVILYPTTYRSWSSLRAKECLRHVHSLADGAQVGFMPTREAAEIWVTLQALIELAVLQKQPLLGFVTDVEKAFESIPRLPVARLALRVGIPKPIIDLWMNFLQHTTRYFALGQDVGRCLKSNSGFPEGCALSCVAMSLTNLVFHAYMKQYARLCRPISYVDNLEVTAEALEHLQQGIVCTQTWAELWKLTLDDEKSYVWAADPKSRHALEVLRWPIKGHAKDLGASMTYGAKRSVADVVVRLNSLDTQWDLLRKVPAGEWKKWTLLQQGLWAKAFYGCSITPLGWQHITQLRTKAMKALRSARAGANPGLKLAILCPMGCDPGFYQLLLVFTTFRRLLQKQPGLADLWSQFMTSYHGQPSHGPFGKLLEMCELIGWNVDPPGFYDHDGLWLSLFEVSAKTLKMSLEDAWAQKIARDLQGRQDFGDLDGIDLHVFQTAQKRLHMAHRTLLQPVRDGSFVEKVTHSKFDLSTQGRCPFCPAQDTMQHRCLECPISDHVRAQFPGLMQQWNQLPRALTERLLPSRNAS